MKLLTLIRHAKSDHDNDLSDFDRPLNEKGQIDAAKIGEYITKNLPKPDLIISSPSVRTATTAETIAKKLDYPAEKIHYVDQLYLCSVPEFIEILLKQNHKNNHICIIAHNPGTTALANMLANENIDNIPTCGVAHIELDLFRWSDIEPGLGDLKSFVTPKNI
ncbi:MAG TPA: histidine phosphatase family protein [Bacteroidales bacterium]|nr:histidine phosphatase family protein [Bacteroidales bacterium]